MLKKLIFKTVMADSDIISLHLPLTDETYKLINDSFLRQCKHGVIISNTSRGQIVDTIALIDHLRSGHVGGACLDVFENEKPETFSDTEKELFSNLYELQNVVLTPHIAGWTHESLELIASILFEKNQKRKSHLK
jgi:D-3-phosphoglycerate dehydrogenase